MNWLKLPDTASYELVFTSPKLMRGPVDDVRTAFEMENNTTICIPPLTKHIKSQ